MNFPDTMTHNVHSNLSTDPRSKNCLRHSHVRFVNMTSRKVDVIWINYEGIGVKYRTLNPKDYFDVTSFVTHPWIFLDSETHTRLVVSRKEVFDVPEPVFLKGREGTTVATRACARIMLPLYSLKECALQVIQKSLQNPNDAFNLEIPKFLQTNLCERCLSVLEGGGFRSRSSSISSSMPT